MVQRTPYILSYSIRSPPYVLLLTLTNTLVGVRETFDRERLLLLTMLLLLWRLLSLLLLLLLLLLLWFGLVCL